MDKAMVSGDPNEWVMQGSDSISASFTRFSQEGAMITPQPTHDQDFTAG